MMISVFDLFSIGIGPSSSHTVGPMRAAHCFSQSLMNTSVQKILIEIFGSLALTGKGHGTDHAILNGLEGKLPETVNPDDILPSSQAIIGDKKIYFNHQLIPFNYQTDFLFHTDQCLPRHTNGMKFSAWSTEGKLIAEQVYYSIGGGFITDQDGRTMLSQHCQSMTKIPYPFNSAKELLLLCQKNNLAIWQLMFENEKTLRTEQEIIERLLLIDRTMSACIHKGCHTEGVLPGILKVKRRAPLLFKKLAEQGFPRPTEHSDIFHWLNTYAMAVNEENSAGGRIVTAPTNGAAGIIPAVLNYYKNFYLADKNLTQQIIIFLLTAGAIAILYKKNASISGAEVGCQGEVGVASSMAAGALTAVLDGTTAQIEKAAEIAMEHHLGMTCDPVAGLVQIPCIERNAMGAVKAVNATRLALTEEDTEHKISLDKVIATMRQTGHDMHAIYKETSLGGLAVNLAEC